MNNRQQKRVAFAEYCFIPVFVIVAVLFGAWMKTAQAACSVTLLSDNFESTTGQTGWENATIVGTAHWGRVSSGSPSAHSGNTKMAFIFPRNQPGGKARFFRSSGISVSGSFETVTLTFWMHHYRYYSSFDDTLQVQVSTDGYTWTDIGPLLHRYDGSTGWKKVTIDLSAYKGQAGLRIGILGTGAGGMDIDIDDVSLMGTMPEGQTFSISGKVTLDGAGIAGVNMTDGTASAVTTADGRYTISGLTDGDYTVTPSRPGITRFLPDSLPVTISCGDQGGVDFESRDGVELDVTITTDELDEAHGGSDTDTGMSLREAIYEASHNPTVRSWIILEGNTYKLTRSGRSEDSGKTGDLDVKSRVVILGAGRTKTTIDGNHVDRVFDVFRGASLDLRDLTVRNGLPEREAPGGGISTAGTVKLLNVAVSDNATADCSTSVTGMSGGDGGGIYCYLNGVLTIAKSFINGNKTSAGGEGLKGANSACQREPGNGNVGGAGGDGGGIAASECTVSIDQTEIFSNETGNGGNGGRGGDSVPEDYCWNYDGGDGGDGGTGGSGGGIWIHGGAFSITASGIYYNKVGTGGYGNYGGSGSGRKTNGDGGDGGDAGVGAGIANISGSLTISESALHENTCAYEDCKGGLGTPRESDGVGVLGGGIYNSNSSSENLTVERCSIYSNKARIGGGIANDRGTIAVRNSTLAKNQAYYCGAVWDSADGNSTIDFCTISANKENYFAYQVEGGHGPHMDNTIIANNEGDEYVGPTDGFGDHNLIQEANPGLGPLRDNGGPTLTMALNDGSPAIDAGDPAVPSNSPDPSTDQRGKTRVSNGRADIGAYEKVFPAAFSSVGLDHNPAYEGRLEEVHGMIANARLRTVTLAVDWGDGNSNTYHYAPSGDPAPFSEGHVYDNNPPGNPTWQYTVTLTLTDDELNTTDTRTLMVTVNNEAPEISDLWLDSPTAPEGGDVHLHGQILDSADSEAFTLSVQWSIHESDTYSLPAGTKTFDVTHRYADNREQPYAITASLVDDDGAPAADQSVSVTVTNVVPAVSNLAVSPQPVNEGSVMTLTGKVIDPGTSDNYTLHVDWGDGKSDNYGYPAGTASFSVTHTYTDDNPTATAQDSYTISVTATDKDGGAGLGSTTVAVKNVAPKLSNLTATPCDEGGTTTLTGTITDPGSEDTLTLTVDWGDGTTDTYPYPAGTTSFSVTHQMIDLVPPGKPFADNVLKVTITDDDTGTSSSRTTVRVTNIGPTLSNVAFHGGYPTAIEFQERHEANLSGDISDPGGAKDSYTLAVDWGDGLNDTYNLATGSTHFDVDHRYGDDPAGSDDQYTATVTLTDDDGASTTAAANVIVHNDPPVPYPDSYDSDEDVVLHVAAPGVLANDTDASADTLHVVTSLSDAVSAHGAKVTINENGSFTYDPTARDCPLQGLAEGESVDDTFTYFAADDDMSPDTSGALGTTVTVHVTGHDETSAIYVDSTATGSNDGSSWTNAFTELQDALAFAWGGNRIDVAAGTYYPDYDRASETHTGDRSASFEVHRGVSVYGGFPQGGGSDAERLPLTYQTVLSGEINDSGSTDDNSYQVVKIVSPDGETPMSSATVVDGFTITGASNDDLEGGGMQVGNASPVISNCIFINNKARYGGGLAMVDGGSPKVVNCMFQGNQAVSSELAGRGGGIYTSGSSGEISNSVFTANTAVEYGGGMALTTGGSSTVSNCSFYGNSAALDGGGIAALISPQVQISNTILWGDLCGRPGCASGEIHDNGPKNTTISYSDVQGSSGSGSTWWLDGSVPRDINDGGGNIDSDPRFTAAPADLHLKAVPLASPAIDAGDNSRVAADAADLDHDGDRDEVTPADLNGFPRFADVAAVADNGAGTPPVVDMGAYETQTNPVLTVMKAGTGTGTVVSSTPAGAIDCGGTCMNTLSPLTPVTLTATPASDSTFVAWVGQASCIGYPPPASCSFTMPAAGSAWVGALFIQTPTLDLGISVSDGTDNVAPGSQVTYTVTVTNAGPSDTDGATVTDVFPAAMSGITWICEASAGSTCTASGSGNINDTVTIPAHGSLTYTATGTVAPEATEALINTVGVIPPVTVPDGNPSNNVAVDTDSVGPESDLAITKTDGVTMVAPGDTVTYTITVRNNGPSDAVNSSVSDVFPTGITTVDWTCTASAGSTCTASGSGNINDTVTVLAGGTLTYTATGTLDGAATGTLVNAASVSPGTAASDPDLLNNAAADTDTIPVAGDLMITVDDGRTEATPGMTTTYTIIASNPLGPDTVTGVRVTDIFPTELTCTWTGSGSAGTSFTEGPVSGNLIDTVDLPQGGSITYIAVCQIASDATGTIVDTASVAVPDGIVDPSPANNTASDSDTLRFLDFGDAPDSGIDASFSYPVRLSEDGARHGITAGIQLGDSIDADTDGRPSVAADADAGDDGVIFTSPLITCEQTHVTVTASAPGYLDAWVDFNADGDWNDDGEQVFASQPFEAGPNDLSFTVPCTATETGRTYARFRFSSAGGLSPNGFAVDGEVEDYDVPLYGLDFGDAPAPYATLLADDGARHAVKDSLRLGSLVDTEIDAKQTGDADGDSGDDGVVFTSDIVPGATASLTVTSSGAGYLDAWIDFDGDGTWSGPGEQIFTSRPLVAGPNNLSFAVPASMRSGATYARFRLSGTGGLLPTGLSTDGEVEDYLVDGSSETSLRVTITDGTGTAVPGGTVTYTIVAGNNGPSDSTSTTVTTAFPVTLDCTWTCIPSSGAVCAESGSGDIADIISLAAGASATYTAVCHSAASATGTLDTTATITPSGSIDPDSSDNAATDSDSLTPQGDVAVAKTDGVDSVVPGEYLTYTITVTNSGPSQADVGVSDLFPGLLSVSWVCEPSEGSSCPAGGAGPIDDAVSLSPGGSVIFTARGKVDPALTSDLVNTAGVSVGSLDDSDTANNSAGDTDTVSPEADLRVTKYAPAEVLPDTDLTYTITISNQGPSDARTVTLTDSLPAGTGFISQTQTDGPGFALGNTGGEVSDAIAVLAAGESASFKVKVHVDPGAAVGSSIENTATADSATTDPDMSNNSAAVSSTVADVLPASAQADGVTIITHGWNPDMAGAPEWLSSMQDAISAEYLGGEQNFGTITVTDSGAGLVAACDPWNIDLTSKHTGGIVIVLDWSAVAEHLNGGPSVQDVASAVIDKIVNGQNGQRPLAELPIHLIGHSRGGALVAELARQLGERGVVVDQLTMLDPHPLTLADPQPATPVLDQQPVVYQNVVFAENYWQNYEYPMGQEVDGAYARQWGEMTGGYYFSTLPVYPNHRNVCLMYQGTVDLSSPVNNGEASMDVAERDMWFDAYENSGANTGFYYSRMGGGDRTTADTPVSGGDEVRAGLINDPAIGGAGARQPLTWSQSAWANIGDLQVLQDGSPLGNGTNNITTGQALNVRYVALDYANANTVTLHIDVDKNPYNGNDVDTIGSPADLSATGADFAQNTVTWDTSAMTNGQTVFVYAEITDSVTGNVRYFYAPAALTFNAGIPVSHTVTPSAGSGGSISPDAGQTVNENSTTSFTIKPDNGYHVATPVGGTCGGSYSGNPADSTNGITYTTNPVTENCTVAASFAINTHTLAVTKTGQGSGVVTSSPAGIRCGADCNETFNFNTPVTLTVTPDAGATFAGWSDDCDVDGQVTMDADKTCAAEFDLITSVTIPAATGNGDITLTTDTPGCGLSDVQAMTEPVDPSFNYPYGLVNFKLYCSSFGASADVRITFPGDITGMTYRKYGPTPPDFNIPQWYTFDNAEISGATVTLHLQDGQLGDDTEVDGIIVDQGGPGQSTNDRAIPTLTEWGMIIFMVLAGFVSLYGLRKQKRM